MKKPLISLACLLALLGACSPEPDPEREGSRRKVPAAKEVVLDRATGESSPESAAFAAAASAFKEFNERPVEPLPGDPTDKLLETQKRAKERAEARDRFMAAAKTYQKQLQAKPSLSKGEEIDWEKLRLILGSAPARTNLPTPATAPKTPPAAK